MNEGATAAIFYLSAAAFTAGAIRAVRASVERKSRDRVAIGLAIAGCLGLIAALAIFLTGPKTVLPF
jgi:hypothetical protein